jgi:hypothetical protein
LALAVGSCESEPPSIALDDNIIIKPRPMAHTAFGKRRMMPPLFAFAHMYKRVIKSIPGARHSGEIIYILDD